MTCYHFSRFVFSPLLLAASGVLMPTYSRVRLCYNCYMDLIPHRELRNDSSKVLARVASGEVIGVTNNGRLAAILSPPAASEIARLRDAGLVRRSRRPHPRFDRIRRGAGDGVSTREILADLRADR